MKKIRDTERPPAPKHTAPVRVARSGDVHLAMMSAPPMFVSATTLCGKTVGELLAVGSSACSCTKCIAASKQSA